MHDIAGHTAASVLQTRRGFLSGSAAALAARGLVATSAGAEPAAGEAPATDDGVVAFMVVGDTHYFADAADPSRLDPRSAAVTQALIGQLNRLVGADIPERAGGGTVRKPFGLIHAGDVIDTGDKTGSGQADMQKTEMAAFERSMGLTGRDGSLDFAVYEVHGNHDSPGGTGHAIDRIIERNTSRPRVAHVSSNGLHYSWDVGDVHFVNLGIVVGTVAGIGRRRRYAPRESLEFLMDDLKSKVGASGRPVVITHHIDIARYTTPVPVDAPYAAKEWDPADVGGFHAALAGFHVRAIFHGHTHARSVWRWDGAAVVPSGETLADADATRDTPPVYDVFNVDNSSHFHGTNQAFFYVEISRKEVVVREYSTNDAWQSGFWTPLVWRRPAVGHA